MGITKEQIEYDLDQHDLWLDNHDEGCRLDWSGKDLSGSCLVDANLTYANLRDCDMSHARLNHADFSYADLRGCNMRNARLTRITFCRSYIDGLMLNQLDTGGEGDIIYTLTRGEVEYVERQRFLNMTTEELLKYCEEKGVNYHEMAAKRRLAADRALAQHDKKTS